MNILKIIPFIFLFIGQSYADSMNISKDWIALLHYKKAFNGLKGNVDDENFYLSSNGKYDPLLEYADNLSRVKARELNFICRFPARAKLLQAENQINLDSSLFLNCKEYQEFLRVNSFKRAYLVFSSYYIESPASAFGHTFLRFSKNDELRSDKSSELLDVGINYGASNTSSNPLVYTLFGIFGGFRGEYASIPYHYKIREYNDFESRDLWSYELNLRVDQKEKLLDHLWELGNTWYYYYFFSGNCSEKILSLLDGISPDWKLLEQLPFYIVPAETIKTLFTVPNLVGDISFRPSKRRTFTHVYDQLNNSEKETFSTIIKNKNLKVIHSLKSEEEKAKTLDAVIEYTDFKFARKVLEEETETTIWKNEILKERSLINAEGAHLKAALPKDEYPHLSHPTHKTQLGYFKRESDSKSILRLNHRFALHDFTDNVIGSPRLSSINFFKSSIDLTKKSIRLNSFTPVEMASMNPWGNYSYPPSITASLNYQNDQLGLCTRCKNLNLEIGVGPSWSFFYDSFIPYILVNTQYYYATSYKKEFEINPGLKVGGIFRVSDLFSFTTDYTHSYAVFNKKENYLYQINWQNYHSKHLNSSLMLKTNNSFKEYGLMLNILY